MLRLLVFLLLAYIIFRVVKAYLETARQPRQRRGAERTRGEEMVLDPQCRSYVPKKEAVFRQDRYFCSEDCAKLYLARR